MKKLVNLFRKHSYVSSGIIIFVLLEAYFVISVALVGKWNLLPWDTIFTVLAAVALTLLIIVIDLAVKGFAKLIRRLNSHA